MLPSALLDLLAAGMDLPVVAWDGTGRVRFWSEGAEALYGLRRDEALGREWPCIPREGLAPEVVAQAARFPEGWRAVERRRDSRGGEIRVHCIVRHVGVGSESLYVETATDPNGERSAMLLRESEARLALMVQHVSEGLLLCDTEGKLRFANPAACRQLEWEAAPLGEPLPHPLGAAVERVLRTRERVTLDIAGEEGEAGPLPGPLEGVLVSIPSPELTRRGTIAGSEREWLERLSRRLMEGREAERREIARELHDEVGQQLTLLRLRLEGGDTTGALTEVEALIARVRRLSLDLRPALLDDLGLLPALLWLCDRSAERGLAVHFQHHGLDVRMSPEVETAAYRVVQEALTNAARHSGASEVEVRAVRKDGCLNLWMTDGGRGFDPELSEGGAGLSGMADRVRLLGGTLQVNSAPGLGTRIRAELPLLEAAETGE